MIHIKAIKAKDENELKTKLQSVNIFDYYLNKSQIAYFQGSNLFFKDKCEYDEKGVLIASSGDKGVKITMADGTIFLAVNIDADSLLNIFQRYKI